MKAWKHETMTVSMPCRFAQTALWHGRNARFLSILFSRASYTDPLFISYSTVTNCGNPPRLPNSQMITSPTWPHRSNLYVCNIGYSMTGSKWINCHDNGSWVPSSGKTFPRCQSEWSQTVIKFCYNTVILVAKRICWTSSCMLRRPSKASDFQVLLDI